MRLAEKFFQKRQTWILLLLALFAGAPSFAAEADPYEEVNANWDRFGAVYLRILENYYTHLDHNQIMRAAIDGMLKELDAYSQFYDEEGMRQLRQDTTGKFAGLGITVGLKDSYPVVIAPIEDTPAYQAGLLPGDLIVEIEGKSTKDISLDEVVNVLRGEPGSKVRLKVARQGRPDGEDLVIERQIIKIKSVALVEELEPGIGYISMRQTRFSEDTAAEVESALKSPGAKDAKGVILDLRGNPGGLLNQAAQVADLVLPKGAPIVSVRERDQNREEKKTARGVPVAETLPLVVLIDEGSASAAEIVAGAVQDNDRGIILGTPSFGKGSVQTIFDLREEEDSALKLTTALYYTPSGRSIHRESRAASRGLWLKVPFGEVELPAAVVLDIILRAADPMQAAAELRARFDLEESLTAQILATPLGDLVGHSEKKVGEAESDSLQEKERQVFYTRKGRKVYGGGGITPDVHVESLHLPASVLEMERNRLFFDFVVDYVGGDSVLATSTGIPEVNDTVLAAFEVFAKKTERPSSLYAMSRERVEALRQLAGEMGWGARVAAVLDSLELAIQEEGDLGVVNPITQPYIRAAIKRELVLRLQGKRASLVTELEGDLQVQAAIELLKDLQQYNNLLGDKASREKAEEYYENRNLYK